MGHVTCTPLCWVSVVWDTSRALHCAGLMFFVIFSGKHYRLCVWHTIAEMGYFPSSERTVHVLYLWCPEQCMCSVLPVVSRTVHVQCCTCGVQNSACAVLYLWYGVQNSACAVLYLWYGVQNSACAVLYMWSPEQCMCIRTGYVCSNTD